MKKLIALESITLAIALFLVIPPIPSDQETIYTFQPVGWIALLFFLASKLTARKRTGETWWIAIIHTLIFLLYGFAVFEVAATR